MKTLLLGTLISLVAFASTSYTDIEVGKVYADVRVNTSKIEMVYDALLRIEDKVDKILGGR